MLLTCSFCHFSDPDVSPCVQRPVDMVFLLDGSERLGFKNFNHMRRFIQQVVDSLVLARTRTDRMRVRMALTEFGQETENYDAFPLTHDPAVIADGMARLPYLDSSSSVGPAIIRTINTVLGKGNSRKTRRNAEIMFVFITDGVTNDVNLDEAIGAMRAAQVVTAVIATRPDTDPHVLKKLAMGDQDAVFAGKDLSSLSESPEFDRFIRWVC